MQPIVAQYQAYNQRRLHYSFLFWACLALQFTGIVLVLLFSKPNGVLVGPMLFGLIGLSCLLMAFITLRLHKLEVHYENLLRTIEEHWRSETVQGVVIADITGKVSSRKLVILALAVIAIGFIGYALVLMT